MTDPKSSDLDDTERPFIAHLIELRDRILRCLLLVLVLFLGLAFYANEIYAVLAGPLLRHMPAGTQMIAIEVASPFLTPFKLTLVVCIFLAIPYILYQVWAFVAPGLYRHERRMVLPLLIASTILFYAGVAFAYFVVFPLMFAFLTATAPPGVAVMTDIARYLDFVLTIFLAFGVAFEVPIATILLVWSGIITRESIRNNRPYIIVGSFVIGMILTPPDVVSQTLLSLPIWFLFEIGFFFSRFFEGTSGERQEPPPALEHHDDFPEM